MTRTRAVVLLVALATVMPFGVAGCGPSSSPKASITAHEWRAVSVEGIAANGANQVTSTFASGTVLGSTGVNQYRGTYGANADGTIAIKLGPMTRMAGSPQEMRIETAFVKALAAAAKFSVTDSSLTLMDAKGTPVVSYQALVPKPLVGTAWRLLSVKAGGGLSAATTSTPLTAMFGSDQTVTGSTGINQYKGTYAASGDLIAFQAPSMTSMTGPEGLVQQESAFVTALGQASTFKIDGDTLAIYDDSGSPVLVFKAE